MRIFLDIGLLVAVFLGVLVIAGQCSAAERVKIYNDRNRQVGDVYCPGHGRRCQIRDNDRHIRYYLEKDGMITDTHRRRVKEIELPEE